MSKTSGDLFPTIEAIFNKFAKASKGMQAWRDDSPEE